MPRALPALPPHAPTPSAPEPPAARSTAARRPRAAGLALAATTALATALGLQLGLAAPASAAPHDAPSAAPVRATATGPRAVDDYGTVSAGATEVGFPGAANDVAGSSPIQTGLTLFPADQLSSLPAGSFVVDQQIYDPDFGMWRINDGGRITFDPSGVTGRRTVRYRITDANGLTDEGAVTVTVTAAAGRDYVITSQGTPTTVDVLDNDAPGRNADGSLGTIDRASLRWRSTQGAPVTVSSDGLVVTFPGVGVFTIDATTRLVTFAPALTYITRNDSYILYYTAQDTTRAADGSVEHHPISSSLGWQVTAAARFGITEKAGPELFFHVGDLLTFTTTLTDGGSAPIAGLSLTHSLGSRLSADVCSPVALGGTLPVGGSTTCTATTRVTQRDIDLEEARVEDNVVATGTTTLSGSTIAARAQTGASTATRTTQGLTVTGAATPSSVSAVGQRVDYTFVVRNRGNRSVEDLVVSASSPGVSALVCSPVPLGGTLGDNRSTTCTASRTASAADLTTTALTAAAKATAVPVSGFHATAANASATVRTTVTTPSGTTGPPPSPAGSPVARPDTASTTAGRPVVVDVLANDAAAGPTVPLVGSSVRLRTTPDLPTGSVLYGDAKTLKVAGRGVFLVSGTGQITFVPLGASTGPVPAVGYQVADAAGSTARTTLTVAVQR